MFSWCEWVACEWGMSVCISSHSPLSSICVFQKISKLNEPFKGQMQFELFEKHMSANKIHIEREKSYDYFLIIHMK